jgi:HPt (histidine-containing phosphotransfer) domain-containing protein
MQDHIAKPIDPDQFYQTLSRWLKQKGGESAAIAHSNENNDTAADIADTNDQLIEIPGFDTTGTLQRIGGSVHVYHRILDMMLPNLVKALGQFDAALQSDDPTEQQHIAHAIRGMSANVGAVVLAEAAAEVEHALMEGHASEQLLQKFRATIATTLITMQTSLAKDGISIITS